MRDLTKHILFIVENRAVPHDTRVWLEATAVHDWGHRVTVISRKEICAEKPRETINGIRVFRHGLPGGKGRVSYILEYGLALFWQLALALRIYIREPFHVIHAANPPDMGFLVAALFRPLGVKFIFDVHDLTPDLFIAKFAVKKGVLLNILKVAEKSSSKLASLIITTNDSYRRIIQKRYDIHAERFVVVRNDPLLKRFPRDREGTVSPDGKVVLLYLGTIGSQDGVDNLMLSLRKLIYDRGKTNILCKIVGDGDALEQLRYMAEEMELTEFVEFTGYIFDQEQILNYLYGADICVEPAPASYVNRYSTFIKVLEYMAASKPIVAFDLEETRASAGESAVYVPPGDVDQMAQAIEILMVDPDRCMEMGRVGRKRIEGGMNWDRSRKSLAQGYAALGVATREKPEG